MVKCDSREILTEEEANEKYYPYSYLMADCVRDDKNILRGWVAAYSPLETGTDLVKYGGELNRSGKFGLVVITNTKDPLDGGSLLGEIHYVEEE